MKMQKKGVWNTKGYHYKICNNCLFYKIVSSAIMQGLHKKHYCHNQHKTKGRKDKKGMTGSLPAVYHKPGGPVIFAEENIYLWLRENKKICKTIKGNYYTN